MRNILFFLILIVAQISIAQSNFKEANDSWLGTYTSAVGESFVIGKSSVRYYLYDPQIKEYRGLYKENDSVWSSYNSLLKHESSKKEGQIKFNLKGESSIELHRNGRTTTARRSTLYSEEPFSFSNDGINLNGTVLLPSSQKQVPAVVLIHGSGEQDRNGYASYMRIIADHLARNGIAVLIYDKRGCGTSEGDWRSASFQELADDALAGAIKLSHHPDIDPTQIGLGGSSQAGWILAKAIDKQPSIPFVFCISGAGMGISAAQQNIYNNRTELENLKAGESILSNSEQAWTALYQYIETGKSIFKEELDALVTPIKNENFLNYFPPPSSAFSLDRKEWWFQTLEVNFNPISTWKNYQGNLYAVFGALDASTPVDQVTRQLRPVIDGKLNTLNKILVYPNSSHLILRATLKSDSEFERLKKFHPYFFEDISSWILQVTQNQSNDVADVLALEKEWLAAYENMDSKSMDKIVDPNFIITFPNGYQQSKTEILAGLKSQSILCPNTRIYTSETKATEHENVVILRGIVSTECALNEGIVSQHQRYTDTYLKTPEGWKVVASHLSNYEF